MSNIDYTQICQEFYTNYEDGCCMENCTFESKGYCPVRYVKGLLEEKDKVIEQLEKENKVNVKELATMFNTKIINDNGELKKQIKELQEQNERLKNWYNEKAGECAELQHQLALTEKALELACKELNKNIDDKCEYCEYKENNIDYGSCDCDEQFETDRTVDYFKTKAKEMIKSE